MGTTSYRQKRSWRARQPCWWRSSAWRMAGGGAQDTGRTVRHHKVAEDSTFPQELTQAEAAIEHKDYATAVPLLNTVTGGDPQQLSSLV